MVSYPRCYGFLPALLWFLTRVVMVSYPRCYGFLPALLWLHFATISQIFEKYHVFLGTNLAELKRLLRKNNNSKTATPVAPSQQIGSAMIAA
jgi:hypothetical protein